MIGSYVIHSRLGLELVDVVGNCLRLKICQSICSNQKHMQMHVAAQVVKRLF